LILAIEFGKPTNVRRARIDDVNRQLSEHGFIEPIICLYGPRLCVFAV
jgi:hypothetical protein